MHRRAENRARRLKEIMQNWMSMLARLRGGMPMPRREVGVCSAAQAINT